MGTHRCSTTVDDYFVFLGLAMEDFFSVTPTQTRSYNDGDRILFDEVHANVGGGWISGTQEFLCQQDGYYLFMVSFFPNHDNFATAWLYKDGNKLLRLYADSGSNRWGQSANMGIFPCTLGERVYLQCVRSGSWLYVDANDMGPYTTFSGMMVKMGL